MKNTFKGFIAGALSASLVLGATYAVAGEQIKKSVDVFYNGIKICIDGTYIEPKDANGNAVDPFIMDGTTYLPVRAVAGAFDKDVIWDGDTQTVFLNSKTEKNMFEKFEQKLGENNIKFDRIKTEASYIGAEEGYRYVIGGDKIEVYRFDVNSEAYKTAVSTGKGKLEALNMSFDIEIIGEYGIVNGTAEIIELFKGIK